MSRDRVTAYKRTLRTYLNLGVEENEIREVVTKIGPTNPGELADALDQYVLASTFLGDRRTTRTLAAP